MFRRSVEFGFGKERLFSHAGLDLESRLMGKVVHLALSFVDTVEDVERLGLFVRRAISMLNIGYGPWDIDRDFVIPMERALYMPEASLFFPRDASLVLKEKDFLDPPRDGSGPKILRPDRVVVKGSEVIVVDYKMRVPESGDVKKAHVEQVKGYIDVVGRTFGLPVRGYVFYIFSPEILEI